MTVDTSKPLSYRAGVILVLLAGLCWSSMGIGIRSIDQANVWQILFFRSLAMSVFLFVLITVRSRMHPILTIKKSGVAGVIGGVSLVMAFSGGIYSVQTTTVANAMFLFASAPFLTAVLGMVLLQEPVRRSTWISIGIALCGITIMVIQGISSGHLAGNLAALGASLGFSIFTIALRWKKLNDMLPTIFLAGLFAMATAAVIAQVQSFALVPSMHDIAVAVAMGCFQVGLGLALYVTGSKAVPAAELALLSMTEVLLAPLWVWLMFGETSSAATLVGGAILMLAIVMNALTGIRRKPPVPPV